jgi:hypothetical protein
MSEHATPAVTPSALRGHGVGIVVCAIFAALWANWARPLLADMSASWIWITAFIVAAASGALLFAGASMILRSRHLPRAAGGGAPRGMRRGFALVLIAEIVALNIAASLLIDHHMAQYLAPAIAAIVGLHFLPLAQIFRSPHFHATATVMTLSGIAAATAIAIGSPSMTANGTAELVCAATLWATGFASWLSMRRAVTDSQRSIVAADSAR